MKRKRKQNWSKVHKIHKAKMFVQISAVEREGIIGADFYQEHLWGDIRPAVLVSGREGVDFEIVPIDGRKVGSKR